MKTLKTPFVKEGKITPANASQISDGSAAVMLVSGMSVDECCTIKELLLTELLFRQKSEGIEANTARSYCGCSYCWFRSRVHAYWYVVCRMPTSWVIY